MEQVYLVENNVRTVLSEGINYDDTNIIIDKSVPPFKNPPMLLSESNERLHLTIISTESNPIDPPNKLEIVRVIDIEDINASQLQLTVDRAQEGTNKYSFSSGSIIFLSQTKAVIDSKANRADTITVFRKRTDENGIADENGLFETIFTEKDGDTPIVYSYPKYE